MEPVEYKYYQLVKGKMVPGKIVNGKLERVLHVKEKTVLSKYSEDQPRDERGRFGSTDGESTPGKLPDVQPMSKEQEINFNSFQVAQDFTSDNNPTFARGLHDYTGNDYYRINNELRGVKTSQPELSEKQREIMDSQIQSIDRLMASAPGLKEEITTYRGLSNGYQVLNTPIGGTFTDKGFSSTSTDFKTATSFTNNTANLSPDPVVLEIVSPVGTQGINVQSFFEDNPSFSAGNEIRGLEKEWLLPRDTTYKVTGWQAEKGYTRVKVEVVQ
jgi:hypothetical protein